MEIFNKSANKIFRNIITFFLPKVVNSGFSSKLVTHRNTEDNNIETYFEFTKENYKEIDHILSQYPEDKKASGCIPLLMMAQKQNNNFLTLAAMNKVAKILEMPKIRVYEVASFYTMFNRTKADQIF